MALLSHVSAHVSTGTTNCTTSAINTDGASLIVVGVVVGNPVGAYTLSDSKGNIWPGLTQISGASSNDAVQIFYCLNPNVGTSHTFTVAMATGYHTVFVAAFDNYWMFESQSTASAGTTTIQPGNITPGSTASTLFFTVVGSDDSPSGFSINSSFTITDTQGVTTDEVGSAAYKLSTTAENPTWTLTSNSTKPNAAMATFAPQSNPMNTIRRVMVGDGMSRSELAS